MCVSIYNICVFMCVDTHSHTEMLLKLKIYAILTHICHRKEVKITVLGKVNTLER